MSSLKALWDWVNGKYGPWFAGAVVLAVIAAAYYLKVTPGYILTWLGF